MTRIRSFAIAALLLGCLAGTAACQGSGTSESPSSGGGASVEQEIGQIESTLDNVESEVDGDR
ncbi:hypothetical protein [Actinokineospora enzanensis]|uniref:hypothetical protein n=1 Tax=Actinokineospora enzanensis TaxID=155975 RepID=UPI00037A9B1B|nr:hypothetical protein [Actinokineospora enzanensis]